MVKTAPVSGCPELVGADCRPGLPAFFHVCQDLIAGCVRPTYNERQCSVPAVLNSVLVLTLLVALDPVRLGFTLLMISRPRPVQNLLAFWVGAMTVSLPYVLVPLIVLHVTPVFRSFAHDLAAPSTGAGSTVRYTQIGIGLCALSIAALMAIRFWAPQRARLLTPATSTMVMDSDTAIPPLLDRAQDAPTGRESVFRRLFGRARDTWDNGSLWVTLVLGLLSPPPPFTILLVLTTIVATGAAIGVQISVAVAFVVGVYAIVEITLVSYLAMPEKTQAVLRRVHEWSRTHRQQIVVAICTVVGLALTVQGWGNLS